MSPGRTGKSSRWTEGLGEGWAARATSSSWLSSAGRIVEQSNCLWREDSPLWVISMEAPSSPQGQNSSLHGLLPFTQAGQVNPVGGTENPCTLEASPLPLDFLWQSRMFIWVVKLSGRGEERWITERNTENLQAISTLAEFSVWGFWFWFFLLEWQKMGCFPCRHTICSNACHLTFQSYFAHHPLCPNRVWQWVMGLIC